MELYGEGLERIVDGARRRRRGRQAIRERLAQRRRRREPAAHPRPLSGRRSRRGCARRSRRVRPYMESHGGDVELLGLEDGVARLRLVGHCNGCPASASTLELAIKEALDEAAPDLAGLEVEGVARRAGARAVARAAADPDARRRRAGPTPTWLALDGAGDVGAGELRTVTAARRRADRRQRRRARCSPTAAPAPAAAPASATRRSAATILTCARCGRALRPAARRARAGRRAGPARAGAAAAARRRRGGGGAGPVSGPPPSAPDAEVVARLRRMARARARARAAARRGRRTRAATCAARAMSEDHRHLLARPRAADPLRLRAVLSRCAPARPTCARRARATLLAGRTSTLSDELWA